jgi:tricarballylate dehydrogenase
MDASRSYDLLVVGGGNAGLCAAITAARMGAKVLIVESAPIHFRGGNTRNMRTMHAGPLDVLSDAYPEEEYWQDLVKVTGGLTDEPLARMAIRHTEGHLPWMKQHGVRFQAPLGGTLHLGRTNAFFLGGGKALVNAYYRAAEALGVEVAYDTEVMDASPRRRSCAPAPRAGSAPGRWSRPRGASNRTSRGSRKPGARPPTTSSCAARPTTWDAC